MDPTRAELGRRIDQARGRGAADLVVKGARFLNVATGELDQGDIAICGDWIVGTHDDYRGVREIDARGQVAVPGFIDTHVHVESSLVTPFEFERAVLPRGTTTAICDPHEIANVLGADGVRYFLDAATAMRMTLARAAQLVRARDRAGDLGRAARCGRPDPAARSSGGARAGRDDEFSGRARQGRCGARQAGRVRRLACRRPCAAWCAATT